MIKKIMYVLAIGTLVMSCNIDQKKDMEMPEVDVDMEEGQLPTFDVDWADVNVGTTTKMVEVPKVVVVMEEEEVEVPYIDVDMPNDDDDDMDMEKVERTIAVEAEVSDVEHDLEIKEIWAKGNNLYVISTLEATDTSIDDKKMRVSDQVTLNAPDLNVKHYIIGERPDRVFNTRYTYVASMDDLKVKLGDGYTSVYSR
ncbi:MAG: hypothetical protein HKN40_06370 [Winogradskyella sp.]|uniref:hypothetical protein n=1 Tax=Winogradskyella sp. TaxID=1883156 RepID=UPI001830A1AA|nr:hypothetical protein [Winogradskyella sp.]